MHYTDRLTILKSKVTNTGIFYLLTGQETERCDVLSSSKHLASFSTKLTGDTVNQSDRDLGKRASDAINSHYAYRYAMLM